MRLAVFTHVVHKEQNGKYYAYSPYVREMNLWFKYVDEVEVLGPESPLVRIGIGTKGEPFSGEAYKHLIKFTRIPSFNLLSFPAIIKALFRIPIISFRILRAMRSADHLHLRCPGNIGLLACICQILFPNKPKTAKYAGNWDPAANQPWTYRLQKKILANTFLTRNMNVLVYGDWSSQSKNVVPFFTASFSERERELVVKTFTPPYRFLFVGNLVPGKQPEIAIHLVDSLQNKNIAVELHFFGNGDMMELLEDRAQNKNYIKLHGNQPLKVIKQANKDAHFLILASKSEGWPKAVAEAMFFGCIPIATEVSCVPWMLNHGSRGILIPEIKKREEKIVKRGAVKSGGRDLLAGEEGDNQHEFEETLNKIIKLIENPEEMRRMSMEAQEWSQQYTLERFEKAIKKILTTLPQRGG